MCFLIDRGFRHAKFIYGIEFWIIRVIKMALEFFKNIFVIFFVSNLQIITQILLDFDEIGIYVFLGTLANF